MNPNTPELLFPARAEFRIWLSAHAQTSGGVWLVFGKHKMVVTLTAHEALEEALCFGWIDGQMRSVDDTRYLKYFAPRRAKSVWSEKNKQLVVQLRVRQIMTPLGEQAVETAMQNGMWDAPKNAPVTDEQLAAFAGKLSAMAHENFQAMPRSARAAYTGLYLSYKTETGRQQGLETIIERLNENLKPMEKKI